MGKVAIDLEMDKETPLHKCLDWLDFIIISCSIHLIIIYTCSLAVVPICIGSHYSVWRNDLWYGCRFFWW